MKTIPYKDFSAKFHKKNWENKKSNLFHFELTFGCALHCKHCYSDCYNSARYIKKELNTREVKLILDKIYDQGILWLCFTGGDPLTRKDFLELYAYAKNKGFIITLFTNGYSMNKMIARRLQDNPPFAIEITLNAVSRFLYEKISRVRGSYVKTIKGIELILKAGLPIKVKTQVMKDNSAQLPRIRRFIERLGLKFHPAFLLHSRLNRDPAPVNLRVSPREVFGLSGDRGFLLDKCNLLSSSLRRKPRSRLFQCVIAGGDGMRIDPYGNLVPCSCIREPKMNLLKEGPERARQEILNWVSTRSFTNNSICQECSIRSVCFSCPGKALLEVSDMQEPIPYFCELAHLSANSSKINNHKWSM